MTSPELELLRRAHALFAGTPGHRPLVTRHSPVPGLLSQSGATAVAYRDSAAGWLAERDDARRVDDAVSAVLVQARRDHDAAQRATAAVLAEARADSPAVPSSPLLAREMLRRRAIRLRNQHAHIVAARDRARRRRRDLGALRYRLRDTRHLGSGRRAEAAVRAALSRIGDPYVWGATGPDRFDCSGLVQWAYGRAGVPLRRTTYQQIHQGVAISPAQVRPGDLVFPHTGHVQMAIGAGLVVEAPQPGATVQISRMGPAVAIRRIA